MNSPRSRTTREKKPDLHSVRKTYDRGSETSPDPTLHGRIAQRAYEIFEKRSHLGPLDDWLQAEREIFREERAKRKAT
ncbi:MAG: DUF2934 domain-containing protein [Nitrospiraceae bacterium]